MSTSLPPSVRPCADVHETARALILLADLPGVTRESVELHLEDDLLHLAARPALPAPAGWQLLGAEFELPCYERTFRLGVPIDSERIEAVLHNGRLRVVLPKRTDTPRESIPVR